MHGCREATACIRREGPVKKIASFLLKLKRPDVVNVEADAARFLESCQQNFCPCKILIYTRRPLTPARHSVASQPPAQTHTVQPPARERITRTANSYTARFTTLSTRSR
ncbi:hypothetical protein EVAR_75760_1 [Eumeta japonica]|uniref:Uncharacterized protein n=1 Tax=Eumeta variegata TaxID=151549 RepID=A0A4C1TCU4_EUMVA|nr:hypothetical protein EVAR_75760_1 [Eumeta japonica]